MKSRPTVVVLAAGGGSRYAGHTHKLERSFGNSTVLSTSLQVARASGLPVLVVTTQRLLAHALRQVAGSDVVVVPEVGSAPHLGMGHSIACGVMARPDASGWVLMPADMPLLQPATLRAVADGLSEAPVAYAQHAGRQGHPVAFGSELYSDLARLTNDEGARRIVARYPSVGVDVDDEGALIDFDTEADFEAWQARGSAAPQPNAGA